ncbi:SDR family NAD(P)-dependent oxidoreductase [Rhodoligotrophos ferricapiens]|uniref:SDR family NAD(P)-dependent oxidoreductase n=1 Tax=Rhodoligotrophos ferricapiens TaxID=3069264 RepID=UPI00315D9617
MSIRLDGRVAVVTGAGNGLGRVYARYLSSLGAHVVVNDLGGKPDGTEQSTRPADQVVEEIRAAGGKAAASYHNVAEMEGAQGIAQTALDAFGRLDILVHNAGILRDKTLLKMEEADFRAVLDVHLMGGVFCTKAALPAMFEQGYGRIVLATSSSALYGLFGQSNYAAAKLGLVGFANAVKFELERKGVLINCVAPSAMTRLTEGLVEERMAVKMLPDFVAPAVAYLASEECKFTGRIMTAGARHFALDQMMESAGVTFEGTAPITVDMLADRIEEVADFSKATPFVSGHEQLLKITGEASPKP